MAMDSLHHDQKYGELDQVVRAYLGEAADDEADRRSAALDAYIRHTWHTRPWALALAERQLREYAEDPPGRLRRRLGEFYPVPDIGLPDSQVSGWMANLADHLRKCVEHADVPPPGTPQTHWEWHARFPELGQLLGGWFSQDMPDEFANHEAALGDYLLDTAPALTAKLSGEVQELLALDLDDSEYTLALGELGMEVEPTGAMTASAWLLWLRDRSGAPPADYRKS